MNNGKVRIYELSKELNLENKDLLGICEDLNIVVKSHSSSISEAESAQIVQAANEKFPDRQKTPASQVKPDKAVALAAPTSVAPTPPVREAVAPSTIQKAPQRPTEPKARILQIEHKGDGKPSLMPQPPVAAQPPLRQPVAATSASRPVVRPTPVGDGTPRRADSTVEGGTARVARAVTPVAPPAPKPQLSGPPARPSGAEIVQGDSTELASTDNSAPPVARSANPNKPVPKSQQVKTEPSNRPAVGAPTSPSTGVVRRPVAKADAAPPLNRPPARIVQIKPQGSGPTRPGAPTKDGAAGEKDDGTPTTGVDLELKRPPLRKPINKGKGWSKEEEEIETAKAKVPARSEERRVGKEC